MRDLYEHLIRGALNEEPLTIKEAIDEIMNTHISPVIEGYKLHIAENMFGGPSANTDVAELDDEEEFDDEDEADDEPDYNDDSEFAESDEDDEGDESDDSDESDEDDEDESEDDDTDES